MIYIFKGKKNNKTVKAMSKKVKENKMQINLVNF